MGFGYMVINAQVDIKQAGLALDLIACLSSCCNPLRTEAGKLQIADQAGKIIDQARDAYNAGLKNEIDRVVLEVSNRVYSNIVCVVTN